MTEAMPFLRKLITFLWPPDIRAGELTFWRGRADFRQYLGHPAGMSPALVFHSPALRAGVVLPGGAGQIAGSISAVRRV